MSRALFEQIVRDGWVGLESLKGRPEDQSLEAKRKKIPTEAKLHDEDRDQLLAAVSGLANADGGVFLFGVHANEGGHKVDVIQGAQKIASVDECEKRIDDAIAMGIEPPITGIESRTISPESEDDGIVVLYIPSSDGGPHRVKAGRDGGKYFLRAGAHTVVMPHTTLAEKFGKRPHPDLRLTLQFKRHSKDLPVQWVEFGLKNVGRGVAQQPAIAIHKPNRAIDWTSEDTGRHWDVGMTLSSDEVLWTSRPEVVLYPKSSVFVLRAALDLGRLSQTDYSLIFTGTLHALHAPPRDFNAVADVADAHKILEF